MSDLSVHLAPSKTQLPVTAYFDVELYAKERQLIFDAGPRYLGHELAVPNAGDYYALPQEGEGRALVRNAQGDVDLLSNVCRHRQAVMLKGRGQTGRNIVCPLHRWTYKLDGELIGAPQFDHDPCLHLQRYAQPQSWNGLLFERNGFDVSRALQGLDKPQAFDFSGYVLDHVEQHVCNYNWKTFIEVYLEDYHVGPFHPGLGQFVTCDNLAWQFATEFSVQTVGIHNALRQAGSAAYAKWQAAVLNFRDGAPPEHGAIWLTLYPNIMVEWYPHVLVVSALYPRGPQKTLNVVEFYYPEEIAAFERDFIEAERAAYMETCVEDDEIALRMDAGRRALMERCDDQAGPYQSPMEDGMRHFHEWYRGKLALSVGAGQT
jgi:choline monooxygenase